MPLIATDEAGQLKGGSAPHLLLADGRWWVTKFVENPQHRRTLLNEWIGAHLLNYLELESPTVDKIFVDPDLALAINGRRSKAPRVNPGIHLGIEFLGNPPSRPVYDFIPERMLTRLQNRKIFWGVLALDKWVANSDTRQVVIARPDARKWVGGHLDPDRLAANCIDQGNFFGGEIWRFLDTPLRGPYFQAAAYDGISGIHDLAPWLDLIQNVSATWLESLVEGLPSQWIAADQECFRRLMQQLYRRRNRVADLVIEAVRYDHHRFRSWQQPRRLGAGSASLARQSAVKESTR